MAQRRPPDAEVDLTAPAPAWLARRIYVRRLASVDTPGRPPGVAAPLGINVRPLEPAVAHAVAAWAEMRPEARRRVWEHELASDRARPWRDGTDQCPRCGDFTAYCPPTCPTITRQQNQEISRCTPNQ